MAAPSEEVSCEDFTEFQVSGGAGRWAVRGDGGRRGGGVLIYTTGRTDQSIPSIE